MEFIWGLFISLTGTLPAILIHRAFVYFKNGKFVKKLQVREPTSMREYLVHSLPSFLGLVIAGLTFFGFHDYLKSAVFLFGSLEYTIYRFIKQNENRNYALLFERVLLFDNKEMRLYDIQIEERSGSIEIKLKNENLRFFDDEKEILLTAIKKERYQYNTRK